MDAALRLRERVFSGEQGVRVEADRDGRDGEALHLVALRDGVVIGTCRLVFDGPVARLGRMAVEPALRRQGVGAALLREAERCAREAGSLQIDLHAQTPAISLYARSGFVEPSMSTPVSASEAGLFGRDVAIQTARKLASG